MRVKNLLFLVACLIFSLNVIAQDDYLRVTDLSQIQNGSSVIFAVRHDSLSVSSYYAMKNDASGKPQGIGFMASVSDEGVALPMEITDNESDYCWIVGFTNGVYTFINSRGDMLGYGSSGTDFVKNGTNSTWTIAAAMSGGGTSVPNHNAFVITNANITNRSIAFRKYSNDAIYEKFAPYANSATNMGGDTYFFYLDIFIKSSEVTPVVALPKFSPESGDYTMPQKVTISCDTKDAVIHYTLDGKNPTEESDVYSIPIEITSKTTIKAFAIKEGMKNSGIATATFNIVETVNVTFYENGVLSQVKTVMKGESLGDMPTAIAPDGFSFDGWSDSEIETYTKSIPNMITSESIIEDDMNLYAVFSITDNNCVEVQALSVNQSDDIVIVASKDNRYYAMSQIKGSSGQPTTKELMMLNGTIVSEISDDIIWNITYKNGEMIISPDGNDENWLYCNSGSNNNSVRIGTNTDNNIFELKTIEIDDIIYSNYLYNKSTERFVGVYYDKDIAVDWRAYKLTASGAFPTNIKNQTYHFFKLDAVSCYCTNIDIPQSQTITTNTIWENVSIKNKIVVDNGATLTINGLITCTNADNFIIRDGGQLIHNNKGVMMTYEKEINGYGSSNEGWYTISSPLVETISMFEIKNLIPSTNDYDLYRYDEPTSKWENVKNTTNNFNSVESGRGYLYANKYDVTVSFVGEVSWESKSYNATKTEGINLSGFHLIGNPFAHDIYKGAGAAIDDENLVDGYYTLSNSGAWEAKISGNEPISPCQGILVKTIKDGEVIINKTNKTSSKRIAEKQIISFNVANDDYKDDVYIAFDEDYGLEKINHQNEDIPMIYVSFENVNYAVAAVKDELNEIPLSFKAKTMGEYTISMNHTDNKFNNIYLFDKMTGNVTNMLIDNYTFVATTNDSPERFIVKLYDINSVNAIDSQNDFVYVSNEKLIIADIQNGATIEIYDVLGRRIYCDVIVDTNKIHSIDINNFHTGLYIVRIQDDNGIRVQKIILE